MKTLAAVPGTIKPLIVWIRFLGIELEAASLIPHPLSTCVNKDSHYFGKIIMLIFGVILLAFNISNNFFLLYTIVSNSVEGSSLNVLSSNIIIDFGIGSILQIGVHTSLILVRRDSKWDRLWLNLNQIHDEIPSIHRPLRRAAQVGLVYIIVESSILIIGAIFTKNEFEQQWTLVGTPLQISILLFAVFLVYSLSGLVVFAVLGYIILLGFQALLLLLSDEKESSSTFIDGIDFMESIWKWRRLHVLLCETTDQLSNCFGFILLLWISHVFVNFINLSFYISNMSSENVTYGILGIVVMIQHCIHLLLIIMVPHKIHETASSIGKKLRRIGIERDNIQQDLRKRQFDLLTKEVFLSLPKITAMDYCDLDLSIVPTLVGTTLTYLVILCQFQSSENNRKT